MSIQIVRKGEIKITREQESTIEANSLGATLAVCLSDPETGVSAAGIFIIPTTPKAMNIPEEIKNASVTSGMPVLFREFVQAGGSASGMKIWLTGCGRFMDSASELDIGLKLYSMAKKIIEKNGLKTTGEHVGGPLNRSFALKSGAEQLTVRLADKTEVIL